MSEIREELVIQNETVLYREIKVHKRVSLADFQKELGRFGSGFCPVGSVFYGHTDKHNLYMIEQPEMTLRIAVKFSEASSGVVMDHTFSIKFPPLIFTMLFKAQAFINLYINIITEPHLTRGDQMLHYLPMYNLYGDSRVCLGRTLSIDSNRTTSGKACAIIDHFWGSVFNTDLSETFRSHMPTEIKDRTLDSGSPSPSCNAHKTFMNWEQLSLDDSVDIKKLSWVRQGTQNDRASRIIGGRL